MEFFADAGPFDNGPQAGSLSCLFSSSYGIVAADPTAPPDRSVVRSSFAPFSRTSTSGSFLVSAKEPVPVPGNLNFMQVTITIPDELAVQAQARGLSPESYIEKLVAEQVTTPRLRTEQVDRLANLDKFFEEMAIHSDKIPLLPDEAFTRDSFYQDRD
jgi:hypothetical protein